MHLGEPGKNERRGYLSIIRYYPIFEFNIKRNDKSFQSFLWGKKFIDGMWDDFQIHKKQLGDVKKRRCGMITVKPMEVMIDSCVIFDSLEDIRSFSDSRKKADRAAINKLIALKKEGVLSCSRTINLELETAKDERQDEINQKWGSFSVRDIGIGLLGNLKKKHYDQTWDKLFMGFKSNPSMKDVDASILAQAEYFGIKYIISTDYDFIKIAAKKSEKVEVIRPVDFLKRV